MLRIVKEGRICRAGLHSPKYTLTIILVPSSRDCMVTLYNRLPYTTVYGPGNIVRVQSCGRIQQVTISLKRDFLMSVFQEATSTSSSEAPLHIRRQRLLHKVHYLSPISIHFSTLLFGISIEM